MLELKEYLAPGKYINSSDERIVHKALLLAKGCRDIKTIVERVFLYVRDQIDYDPEMKNQNFKASAILVFGRGNSAGKACLLAALCRANEIPAGISFQRLQDLKQLKGNTQRPVIKCHAITNIYVEGHWIKLDPTLNRWFTLARNCFAPGFNIDHDALIAEKDWNGADNYRIMEESPVFNDLPTSCQNIFSAKEC